MAINYATAVKTARMTATRDHFADGELRIGTAGMATIIVTHGLNASGGTIATDTWTLVLDNTTVAAVGSGVAVEAEVRTNGGSADLTGLTVGTSGTDIILDNNNIASGQNVTISSATIQHAP